MLQAARAAKMPVALVTELASGAQAMIADEETSGNLTLSPAQFKAVQKAIAADKSGVMDAALIDGERDLFVQIFNPPLRLILIGAVHIAQSLVPMAALAGYEVIVIDPRRAWASDLRFPDVTVVHDWPDDAL
jgi:xanthine dehydrogenase accessory factor